VTLPSKLTLNAFAGGNADVSGTLADRADRWGSQGASLERQQPLAPAAPADLADWSCPDVGWGVVLADRDDLSAPEKARALDAPEPIRRLLDARAGAPVFRYRRDLGTAKLARYFLDGTRQDPEIGLSKFGTAKGRLPLYLLIVGTPAEIPWRLQYSLNRRHHVGRLDLPEAGLANYVSALLSGWAGMDSDPTKPLLWSVGNDPMTRTMEVTIVSQVNDALARDNELASAWICSAQATAPSLVDALAKTRPALVLTSSHGMTGPLEDASAMAATLGLPVDVNRQVLDLDALLEAWEPSGAVWYAQACCSAGSDDGTSYEGLLGDGSRALEVLRAVGDLGASTAPLPARLLGAPRPLRAFVGHVEPTFDWTLSDVYTGQQLTGSLVEAVYPNLFRRSNLFRRWPVGMAFDEYHRGVGVLYGKLRDARDDIDKLVAGARDAATYYRLTATDRESLVILGDPTAAVAPLPSQR
jgi:hypothetical protein